MSLHLSLSEVFIAFANTLWAEMLGKSHRYIQHLLQHAKHARMTENTAK